MVKLPWGFSPTAAIRQVLSPTSDQDIFSDVTFRGGDRGPTEPITFFDGLIGAQPGSGGSSGGGNRSGGSSAGASSAGSGSPAGSNALSGSVAPGGGGYGGGAEYAPLNQAQINNTQRTINEIPGLLRAALAAETARYNNTMNRFNEQERQQRGVFDRSTVTNQQNYDDAYMDALRAGSRGLGSIMSILSGSGALGGSVEDDVRGLVGGITAQDIRTGADTQKENQEALQNSLSSFLSDLRGRREENKDALGNNRRAITRDSNTQLQKLYGDMAGYYKDAGRIGDATSWMNKAGDLTPSIARNSRTQVSKYNTSPIAVKSPELTAFAAPEQPETVTAPQDGQIGAGLFTMTRRRSDDRDDLDQLAGV